MTDSDRHPWVPTRWSFVSPKEGDLWLILECQSVRAQPRLSMDGVSPRDSKTLRTRQLGGGVLIANAGPVLKGASYGGQLDLADPQAHCRLSPYVTSQGVRLVNTPLPDTFNAGYLSLLFLPEQGLIRWLGDFRVEKEAVVARLSSPGEHSSLIQSFSLFTVGGKLLQRSTNPDLEWLLIPGRYQLEVVMKPELIGPQQVDLNLDLKPICQHRTIRGKDNLAIESQVGLDRGCVSMVKFYLTPRRSAPGLIHYAPQNSWIRWSVKGTDGVKHTLTTSPWRAAFQAGVLYEITAEVDRPMAAGMTQVAQVHAVISPKRTCDTLEEPISDIRSESMVTISLGRLNGPGLVMEAGRSVELRRLGEVIGRGVIKTVLDRDTLVELTQSDSKPELGDEIWLNSCQP